MASKALNNTTKASTSVAVRKAAAGSIVSISEAIKAQAAAMNDRIAPPSGNKIKLAPNQITLPDGSKSPGPIEAVIVDFVSRNMFYEGAYDPNNIVPPVCFAIGNNPKTLVPSPNSTNRQAESCDKCPMNAFGSNGAGKACKNERLLALLPAPVDGEEPSADDPLWLLSVSPTALKGFDGYVGNVARTFETPPVGVVTTISLDETKTYASPLFGEPAPNPHIAAHFARQGEARELLNVEPDMTPRQQAAKPAAKGAARPPVRQAARR